jgi:hypothetical protein
MNTALCVRYPSFYRTFYLSEWEHKVVIEIQGVSGGIVNILGGGSMDYSE